MGSVSNRDYYHPCCPRLYPIAAFAPLAAGVLWQKIRRCQTDIADLCFYQTACGTFDFHHDGLAALLRHADVQLAFAQLFYWNYRGIGQCVDFN